MRTTISRVCCPSPFESAQQSETRPTGCVPVGTGKSLLIAGNAKLSAIATNAATVGLWTRIVKSYNEKGYSKKTLGVAVVLPDMVGRFGEIRARGAPVPLCLKEFVSRLPARETRPLAPTTT